MSLSALYRKFTNFMNTHIVLEMDYSGNISSEISSVMLRSSFSAEGRLLPSGMAPTTIQMSILLQHSLSYG